MTHDVSIVRAQICRYLQTVGAVEELAIANARTGCSPTRSVSLEANLSTGMMKRKKKMERIANPLAVRV